MSLEKFNEAIFEYSRLRKEQAAASAQVAAAKKCEYDAYVKVDAAAKALGAAQDNYTRELLGEDFEP